MGSNATKAAISFVKIVVALGAGYGIYYFWSETGSQRFFDESIAGYTPYLAGLIVAMMVFLLLTKMSKGSGGD